MTGIDRKVLVISNELLWRESRSQARNGSMCSLTIYMNNVDARLNLSEPDLLVVPELRPKVDSMMTFNRKCALRTKEMPASTGQSQYCVADQAIDQNHFRSPNAVGMHLSCQS